MRENPTCIIKLAVTASTVAAALASASIHNGTKKQQSTMAMAVAKKNETAQEQWHQELCSQMAMAKKNETARQQWHQEFCSCSRGGDGNSRSSIGSMAAMATPS